MSEQTTTTVRWTDGSEVKDFELKNGALLCFFADNAGDPTAKVAVVRRFNELPQDRLAAALISVGASDALPYALEFLTHLWKQALLMAYERDGHRTVMALADLLDKRPDLSIYLASEKTRRLARRSLGM